MSNIYVITYNNYYNRLVKRESTLSAYLNDRLEYELLSCNFNPNDGVNTEHVLGTSDYDGKGDYVVITNNNNEIESRWFIIEAKRTRQGQWRMQLHRDVVVDYYDAILESKCFIEKGTIPDNDSAIFNRENITLNQIKSSEKLLFDKSNVPWIVGYYDRSADSVSKMRGNVVHNSNVDAINIGANTIEEWELFQYTDTPCPYGGIATNIYTLVDYERFTTSLFNAHTTHKHISESYPNKVVLGLYAEEYDEFAQIIKSNALSYGIERLRNTTLDYIPNNTVAAQEILSLSGKLIRAGDKIYRVSVDTITTTNKIARIPTSSALSLIWTKDVLRISESQLQLDQEYQDANTPYELVYNETGLKLSLVEIPRLALSYDMTDTKNDTVDAPYNIFCIPYGNVNVIDENSDEYTTSADIAMATAMSIAQQQAGRVYDLQLLPYCPVPNNLVQDGVIMLENTQQYSRIVDGEQSTKGFIINVSMSSFTTTIEAPIVINDVKLESECDTYRLCSPNWASIFEFNAAKNGGVDVFNVSCTYKPFTPYIRIAPNFSRLYGQDYKDARGLVLGGDFSLPVLIDNWESYQIQNKNYQLTFDRQIKNMEIKQSVQMIQDVAGAFTGTIQGAMSGAMAGGGPWGAVGGAIASGVGGVADIALNEWLRNEAIDYTKDQFGYALQNIQALPHTLSKVSAYNSDNKYVPVLEYYTCTEEEKEALRNKLKYNGMTIMRVGRFGDYTAGNFSYIKCKLIRINDVGEDFHIINAISSELDKGVFV